MDRDGQGHHQPELEIGRGKGDPDGDPFGDRVDEHGHKDEQSPPGESVFEEFLVVIVIVEVLFGPAEEPRPEHETENHDVRGRRALLLQRQAFLGQREDRG